MSGNSDRRSFARVDDPGSPAVHLLTSQDLFPDISVKQHEFLIDDHGCPNLGRPNLTF